MQWWMIIKREMRQIFVKDPRLAVVIFGASIIYLVIFSLLYGTHVVNYVPLAIYDEDQSYISRGLIQAFTDSEKFDIVAQPATVDEMQQMLQDHTVYAAVHIQRGFAKEIVSGRSSPVFFMTSGINLAITNTATTAAAEIVGAFSHSVSTKLAEKTGLKPSMADKKTAPVRVSLRVHGNPTLSYLYFFVIGLSMAAFQQAIFLPVGASMIGEYQRLHELEGNSALKIVGLKLLLYYLLDTLSFFLTLLMAVKVFAIPCRADLFSILLLSTAFIFCAMGFSAVVSSLCDSEVTFSKLSLIYAVPAFTLSGYMWPFSSMDIFSQILSYFIPLTYFGDSLRDLLLSGHTPLLVRNVLILYFTGVALIGLAVAIFAYRRKQILSAESIRVESVI